MRVRGIHECNCKMYNEISNCEDTCPGCLETFLMNAFLQYLIIFNNVAYLSFASDVGIINVFHVRNPTKNLKRKNLFIREFPISKYNYRLFLSKRLKHCIRAYVITSFNKIKLKYYSSHKMSCG